MLCFEDLAKADLEMLNERKDLIGLNERKDFALDLGFKFSTSMSPKLELVRSFNSS